MGNLDNTSPGMEGDTFGASSAVIDSALACFILLAKFLGVPADPNQIHHDRGQGDEPYTLEHLSRIAKKLGLV